MAADHLIIVSAASVELFHFEEDHEFRISVLQSPNVDFSPSEFTLPSPSNFQSPTNYLMVVVKVMRGGAIAY